MPTQAKEDQVQEELSAIAQHERTIAKHHGQIEEARRRIRIRQKRLQRLVRNGASTGDRIRDYVIAHLGGPRDEAVNFFRMIDADVREHQGQLTLVATASTRPMELGANVHSVLAEQMALGVIDGEMTFSVTDPKLHIPASRDLVFTGDQSDLRKSLAGGPWLPFAELTWMMFRKPIEETYIGTLDRQPPALKLDVRFGDADVVAWFAERGKARLLLLRDLCLKLEYPPPSYEALSAAIEEERKQLIRTIIENDAELDCLQGIIRSARAPRSEITSAVDGLRACARRLHDSLLKAEQIGLEHPDIARIRSKAEAAAVKTTAA